MANTCLNFRMGKKVFYNCINKTEEEFEETWQGWLVWNVPPYSVIVQASAAVHCVGCCEGKWKKGCDGKMK